MATNWELTDMANGALLRQTSRGNPDSVHPYALLMEEEGSLVQQSVWDGVLKFAIIAGISTAGWAVIIALLRVLH
jgi:hypothetical protein